MRKDKEVRSDLFNTNGADFSECKKHRLALWRIWDNTKPKIMFIGLNPSTANEIMDDPTIRKVKGFASRWGFGGIYMLNLFTIISPDPKVVSNNIRPFSYSASVLRKYSEKCTHTVFAWGAFGVAKDRAFNVAKMFPDAIALHINKDGSPKHPLYVSYKTEPVIFSSNRPVSFENGTMFVF